MSLKDGPNVCAKRVRLTKPVAPATLAEHFRQNREAYNILGREIQDLVAPNAEQQKAFLRLHEQFRLDFGSLNNVVQIAGEIATSPAFMTIQNMQLDLARALPDLSTISDALAQSVMVAGEWSAVTESIRALGAHDSMRFGLEKHFLQISELSLMTQANLEMLQPDALGLQLGVSPVVQESLRVAMSGITESYSSLISSIGVARGGIGAFDPLVSGIPPIEYYNNARISRAVTEPELDVSDEDLELTTELKSRSHRRLDTLLTRIDPELCTLWQGAQHALASRNPDRVRHFATSLRELYTHTVQAIAPDEQIAEWTADPELFHNGRPKRSTRLRFICRGIDHGPFVNFVRLGGHLKSGH